MAYADTAGTHKQSVHKHDKNVYTNETKLGNRAEKFIETKLSKILIYKNNIDSIIGYVHSSDLFRNPRNIRSLLLPLPDQNHHKLVTS